MAPSDSLATEDLDRGAEPFCKRNIYGKGAVDHGYFDSLHTIPYAALKFHDKKPEKLSLDSDIDILMSSQNAERLIRFLKRNSLAERVVVSKIIYVQGQDYYK